MNDLAIGQQAVLPETGEGFNFADPRFLEAVRLLLKWQAPVKTETDDEASVEDAATRANHVKIALRMKQRKAK